jgi:hypothetical protein
VYKVSRNCPLLGGYSFLTNVHGFLKINLIRAIESCSE